MRKALAVFSFIGLLGLAACWYFFGEYVAANPSVVGPPPDTLPIEVIQLDKQDGSQFSAWFAPGHPGQGAIILLHPLQGSRLGMLGRARFLHREGYSVLLFDHQAHGENPGSHTGLGWLERHDAHTAVDYLRERLPDEKIAIIGFSLGGAAALLGPAPAAVDALVIEAVYPTIEEALENRIRLRLGPLAPLLAPLLIQQLKLRLDIDPAWLRPVDAIAQVTRPVFVIGGAEDDRTPPTETQKLFAAANSSKQLWIIEGAKHENFHRYAGKDYETKILVFLTRAFSQ